MGNPHTGYRILVDRLWPRGLRKDVVKPDLWLKDVAPSTGLREWFNHEPEKFDEFRKRYFRELDGRQEAVMTVLDREKQGRVVLLYGARDPRVNHAAVLKEYLESRKQE